MRVISHALFIKYIHLLALGHVKNMGRGAYAHAAKTLFARVVISFTVCTECGWVAI